MLSVVQRRRSDISGVVRGQQGAVAEPCPAASSQAAPRKSRKLWDARRPQHREKPSTPGSNVHIIFPKHQFLYTTAGAPAAASTALSLSHALFNCPSALAGGVVAQHRTGLVSSPRGQQLRFFAQKQFGSCRRWPWHAPSRPPRSHMTRATFYASSIIPLHSAHRRWAR